MDFCEKLIPERMSYKDVCQIKDVSY